MTHVWSRLQKQLGKWRQRNTCPPSPQTAGSTKPLELPRETPEAALSSNQIGLSAGGTSESTGAPLGTTKSGTATPPVPKNAVFVQLIATYRSEDYPQINQMAVHHFVDLAPEFGLSRGIINSYSTFPECYFDVSHSGIPEQIPFRGTHQFSGRMH